MRSEQLGELFPEYVKFIGPGIHAIPYFGLKKHVDAVTASIEEGAVFGEGMAL